MMKLAAYADRLSVRPGETIRFHAANATDETVEARLVRVGCADANPAGPGVQLEPLSHQVHVLDAPGPEPVQRGSYAVIDGVTMPAAGALHIGVRIFATRVAAGPQCILSWIADDESCAVDISVDGDGLVQLELTEDYGQKLLIATAHPIAADRWYTVSGAIDRVAVQAGLTVHAIAGGQPGALIDQVSAPLDEHIHLQGPGSLQLALSAATTAGNFNGRIEAPEITTRDAAGAETVVGRWDLSRDISSQRIIDTGPHGLHGRLVNTPARAVTGSTWTGREMNWRHAPDQYAAIHFHDDDMDDCQWPVAFEWTVPADVKSGTYALLLTAGPEADNVPFFVVPPKGRAAARVAVLASTFTYTVYGNFARPEWFNDAKWQAAWREQSATWGAYPHNPGDHVEYGLSTYNHHGDGTGIAHASWHRPMLNARIGYITYPYPDIRGSGLRHFPADTHLTAWLEAKGIAYDIITDWELHHEGHELLQRYATVLTGTHPEYHTREMLDALTRYRDGGGRFAYLGGNGFYWKIALSPDRPGLIEIRRGEGGIRAWAADPGEYYNQFDGEYGGLWRRNGRAPQQLVGVGFTAQGNFAGSHYRRTPEAANPRVAWIFAGIDGDIIGDFGLSGHGAAGFELDRTDKRLGTPANAIVVARSENHAPDAPWVLVPEEQLTHLTTLAGRPHRELIHADMTFFTTAGGRGAVFATGSITFCGSLPVNGFSNPVSRLLENVVRRFLDEAPFAE